MVEDLRRLIHERVQPQDFAFERGNPFIPVRRQGVAEDVRGHESRRVREQDEEDVPAVRLHGIDAPGWSWWFSNPIIRGLADIWDKGYPILEKIGALWIIKSKIFIFGNLPNQWEKTGYVKCPE